jgi:hypothetical protein
VTASGPHQLPRVVVRRDAWAGTWDEACSTSPCCGREMRVPDAYRTYCLACDRAWNSVDAEPTERFPRFWRGVECLCRERWMVAFTFSASSAEGGGDTPVTPVDAYWRRAE